MESSEVKHIIAALVIFTLIIGASLAWNNGISAFAFAFFFAAVILLVSIASKKIIAFSFDADVTHEIWKVDRYGFRKHWHLLKEIPMGLIAPLFILFFSLGQLKVPALLTYDTKPKKIRAAKRFGIRSYTQMTDWHNSLIGASGTIGLLILIILCYIISGSFSGYSFELIYLAKMATFYIFWNIFPVSKLDGSQILMGSKVLYGIIAIITVLFTAYALMLPV